MEIIDVIDQCQNRRGQRHRELWQIKGIMVHRCGINLVDKVTIGYDPVTIAGAFTGTNPNWPEVRRATGGDMPYSFLIGGDGDRSVSPADSMDGIIWQCLPLSSVGPHARGYSRDYISIGLVADPRVRALTRKQYDSLVDLCVHLYHSVADPYPRWIVGHGEVDGAHGGTKSPGEKDACPGDMLPMHRLRDDVKSMLKRRAYRDLMSMGVAV